MNPNKPKPWTGLILIVCLLGGPSAPLDTPLLAQPPDEQPDQPADPDSDAGGQPASTTEGLFDENVINTSNCPPSTMTKILVGVIGLALLALCYFLIVHIVERRYIQQDRSASLGRHVGFSISIFLTAGGILGSYWGLTRCPWDHLWPWLLVGVGVWFAHLLYLLVVVRND